MRVLIDARDQYTNLIFSSNGANYNIILTNILQSIVLQKTAISMGNGSYYAEIMFVTAGAYDLNV